MVWAIAKLPGTPRHAGEPNQQLAAALSVGHDARQPVCVVASPGRRRSATCAGRGAFQGVCESKKAPMERRFSCL
jgi:hypothetical protein